MSLAPLPPDADVAQALQALDARVARIEQAVLRMSEAMEQLPGLTAMAADAADEEIARLADRGVDVDDRARRVVHLTETLTRPEVLQTLERLTAQAVALEGTVGMVGDIADAAAARIEADTGVNTDDRMRALVDVSVRLSDPATLATLQRLLDQAESLEGTVGMVLDIADDASREISERTGTDTDARLRALLELAIRASEPATLARLGQLLDQVDLAEGTVGMVLDIADELVADLSTEGVDAEERLQGLARLARRLSEPRTVGLAHTLLDKADALEQLMEVALAAPDTVGMLLDMLDAFLAQAEDKGVRLDELGDTMVDIAWRAARLVGSPELQALIDSAVLDPEAVRAVGAAADALVEARSAPAGRAGLFKAMGALGDPQIQASLDFAIRFGRAFGTRVEDGRQLPDRT